MYNYLGLLFELAFLGLGVYLYLFVNGAVKFKDPETRQRADAFRQKNQVWLRLLAIGLIAIMGMNAILSITSIWNG